ncbi:MAG: AAA family ATPase [Deltaproteobacteria bacterium]|nr:AAA family ATPase [Deltaproteobacteria bacterium]
MRCLGCSCENEEGAQFCEECGTALVRACPSCGREVRATAKFCSKCGTALTTPASPTALLQRGQPPAHLAAITPPLTERGAPEAERRQLTVMFCDLVGSTPLSEQLDPEELREVVLAYQEACAEVIHRFDGYIARYVGDALLVYFGYPQAHEDDAQRAVRAALGIVAVLPTLNQRLQPVVGTPQAPPLQVRIGIHTGLVVVGELGGRDYREAMALGETPNVAARLQGLAGPDTVLISAATHRLILGLFECQDRGPQTVKGISTPVSVYCVVRESDAQSRFEVALHTGLTPLVGRDLEVGLLQERWQRATQGAGQVVLLSGEPGIGKSRLLQELKEHVVAEGGIRLEFRCSPYHQNSAFYPIIEHLQRLLQFHREETPQTKLSKLEQILAAYRFPQADTLPLLAALLSLPHPADTPPLTLSPQKQKQKIQEALVAWLREEAERQVLYTAWEDLHWVDPSTLEVLTLLLDQVPTTRLLAVLTFRPDFTPPWGARSYLMPLTLSRLERPQVETMVGNVIGGKALPPEVVQQIIAKTDGVPLFVEELTKTVLESVASIGSIGSQGRMSLQAIPVPATLQDSLMARLDRLNTAKEIAQLGATLGREFSYELLQAVAPAAETRLQQALTKLVDAEVLYQRGLPPQAHYLFKHALIQDAAYQSLLKSTRKQYHQQIARVLEEQFAETAATQPELLAHHYTEAGLMAQAIPCWHKAGQRATYRSANVEAFNHLTKELDLLNILPDTPERTQQELMLQIALGAPLIAIRGWSAPEVGKTYARALELCRRIGETPQIFPVLWGLCAFYTVRAEYKTARELGRQLVSLAQSVQDPTLLLLAHYALGQALHLMGEFTLGREHLEQALALYDPQQHRSLAFLYGSDSGVLGQCHLALVLRHLGYPNQALKRINEALTLARELSHPFSLAFALTQVAMIHQFRREGQAAQKWVEEAIVLSTEQGFPFYVAVGAIVQGTALVEQGQGEKGIAQLRQGLAAFRDMGVELGLPTYLAMLAEAYGKVGQTEEGLTLLAEALAVAHRTEGRVGEAEVYRLKGELTLQLFNIQRSKFKAPASLESSVQSLESEAEGYFLKAIEVARQQQAKSWELRAVMSLSRLWKQQGRKKEAQQLLAETYGWFTEGFDTKDLQEAKALLEELA